MLCESILTSLHLLFSDLFSVVGPPVNHISRCRSRGFYRNPKMDGENNGQNPIV